MVSNAEGDEVGSDIGTQMMTPARRRSSSAVANPPKKRPMLDEMNRGQMLDEMNRGHLKGELIQGRKKVQTQRIIEVGRSATNG